MLFECLPVFGPSRSTHSHRVDLHVESIVRAVARQSEFVILSALSLLHEEAVGS